MKLGKFLITILLSFTFSNTASATIVTDYYDETGQTFTLSFGVHDVVIDPLYKAQAGGYYSAPEYYGYNDGDGWAANTPDDLERSNTAIFFLFFDDQELSLFTILDIPNDGDGTSASISYSGLPSRSFWTVRDDPGDDSYELNDADGTSTVSWRSAPCCTDGGVIGRLSLDSDWDIFIKPNVMQGISAYKFLTFENGQVINSIQMPAADAFNGFHIKSQDLTPVAPNPNEVSEPMNLSLMVFGLLGFALIRRSRSNKAV